MAEIVSEDTGAKLTVNLIDPASTPINLAGCTVQYIFDVDNGGLLAKRTVSMTIVDAPTGKVEYQFVSSDLPRQTVKGRTTSIQRGEVRITDGAGKTRTSVELITLIVRNRL